MKRPDTDTSTITNRVDRVWVLADGDFKCEFYESQNRVWARVYKIITLKNSNKVMMDDRGQIDAINMVDLFYKVIQFCEDEDK